MRRFMYVLVVVAVLACCATLALADDLVSPPWNRGDIGTTRERWEFTTQQQVTPDDADNPYGTATASFAGDTWYNYHDNRSGVWRMSGTNPELDFIVPNALGGFRKDIQLQLTWTPTAEINSVVVMCNGVLGTLYKEQGVDPSPWLHSTWRLSIFPNPNIETIRIIGDGTFYVDEVVIDTHCIPEPSSLLALASGVFGLAGLAWRKRRP